MRMVVLLFWAMCSCHFLVLPPCVCSSGLGRSRYEKSGSVDAIAGEGEFSETTNKHKLQINRNRVLGQTNQP